MRKLTNKKFETFDYVSRYTSVPYYYDVNNNRNVYGIGEQLSKDIPYVTHKVKPEDSLDALALTYYNNPTYWWVIAYFNRISDPFVVLHLKYSTLKIPSISGIKFENERA